jgi:uncharacterized protein YdaU (DUF1376 family)
MTKPRAPLNLLIDIRGWQEQTATLTPAESGAFLRLKMHYWRTGQIPDRDAALAQIAGMGIKEWKDAREGLEPLFIVGNGEWFRTDWSEELEAAYVALQKYRKASQVANKARWDKQKRRAGVSDSESGSDSNPESGKDSDSHPASLLKYISEEPLAKRSDLAQEDGDLEALVSAVEAKFSETAHGI